MQRLGKTTYEIKSLHGRRKTTLVLFYRLKLCVMSDDKLENTDGVPVQQEEAAFPEIAILSASPLDEQSQYPVQDRQHTQRYGIYLEH